MLALLLGMATLPSMAQAKAGVFLNGEAYFAVDEARISGGAGAKTLQLRLELVNGSGQTIDFNHYGVKITDGSGSGASYSASLAERAQGRVQPGRTAAYKFVSQLPASVQPSALHVTVFRWDTSSASFMRDIGSLPLNLKDADAGSAGPSVMLDLGRIDSSASGSFLTFEFAGAHMILKDRIQYAYADLRLHNYGGTAVKLPANLTFFFTDRDGNLHSAAIVSGGSDAVMPGQPGLLTVRAAVPFGLTDAALKLSFGSKLLVEGAELASLPLAGAAKAASVGEARGYAALEGVKLVPEQTYSPDGLQWVTRVTLQNDSSSYVPSPVLSGNYQFGRYGSIAAADSAAHPDYLAPGAKTTYRFSAALPAGVKLSDVRLVVSEKLTAAASSTGTGGAGNTGAATASALTDRPVLAVAMSADGGSSVPGGAVSGTSGVATAGGGALQVTLKRTDRLIAEKDDVLVHELEIANTGSSIVTLPAFYGGISYGSSVIQGKAVRTDSASMLSPGHKTSVYVFSKAPHDLKEITGEVYMGETTADAKAADGREWIRLKFTVGQETELPELKPEQTGSLQGGYTLTVLETKRYMVGKQPMLAVKVLQKAPADSRSATVAPLAGTFIGPDGSVWTASVTEQPGRLCAGCEAVSTLWTVLPEGAADPLESYSLVFGRKLDEGVYAEAKRVALAELRTKPSTDLRSIKLYPYTVTIRNFYAQNVGLKRYQFSFDYSVTQEGLAPAGALKNRVLHFVFLDRSGNVLKTWDYPITGTGALSAGKNILAVDIDLMVYNIGDLDTSLYVYEKLETGIHLLGRLDYGM